MKDHVVHTEEYKGYTINLHVDQDATDPRDYDNLGTMVLFHRRYILGDKDHGYDHNEYHSWAELREAIQLREGKDALILTMTMMDHSGLYIRCGRGFGDVDPGGWDSGQIGFIFVSRKRIREEMARPGKLRPDGINHELHPIKHVTKKDLARAEECLRGEVETYAQFVEGDVYGFVIEDFDENHIDSCWGYYGTKDAIAAAKESVDSVFDSDIREAYVENAAFNGQSTMGAGI